MTWDELDNFLKFLEEKDINLADTSTRYEWQHVDMEDIAKYFKQWKEMNK